MIATQGGAANRSGRQLEGQVASALQSNGIAFCPQFETGWLSVLGKWIRSDFYLPRPPQFEDGLHIECRWQDSSGTADEKVCYLKENIKAVYARPAIVVCDGQESESQYHYLKSHVDGKKLIGVFTLAEFLPFCASMSLGTGRTVLRSFNPDQKNLF